MLNHIMAEKTERKAKKGTAGRITFSVFLVVSITWVAALRWMLTTWAHLTLEQLIYQIKAPTEGTSVDIIRQGILQIGIPLLGGIVLSVVLYRKSHPRRLCAVIMAAAVICDLTGGVIAWNRLEVGAEIANQLNASNFIENNYVDPQSVNLTFPEKKRNLIYIYLESMETTYADKQSGGGFEKNVVPELTKLAQENECFAGDSSDLNGGYAMPGATWTMGGLFAQTSGLPLKIGIDGNSMDSQDSFFPGITTLGDILQTEGYKQVFMIGSDANFGGRRVYFEGHGNYEIQDYNYALENGEIPKNYHVWWGYEDEKLFENAKNELQQLTKSNEPFNLTLLTVDTHFEDGYICDLCDNTGEDQYGTVMSCSSRQVNDFVRWVQEQDFYQDTTIVLSGDHLTMDSDFCNDVSADYQRRVYTVYINAADESKKEHRTYTTFDNFPTTLAAMGVRIEGNRLGLGTNLFSEEKTLVEQLGKETLENELGKRSVFMERMSEIDMNKYDEYTEGKIKWEISLNTYPKDETTVVMSINGVSTDTKKLMVEITDSEGKNTDKVEAILQPDRTWQAELNLSDYERAYAKMQIWKIEKGGKQTCVYKYTGDLRLACSNDFNQYLENLQIIKNDGYAFFFSIKDEGTASLTDQMQEKLFRLGSKVNLQGEYRASYVGVFRGEYVREQMGYDHLEEKGILPDGQPYTISSGAWDYGNTAQIILEKNDYAPNSRGINAVVYDCKMGRVVNRAVFDTYAIPDADVKVRCTETGEYDFTVSKAKGIEYEPTAVTVQLWDAVHPAKVQELELTREDNDTYTAKGQIEGIDMTNCYIEAYATDTSGNATCLKQIHGDATRPGGIS